MSLERPGITELAEAYATGSLSPVDVVKSALRDIEELDPHLHSFMEVRADAAVADARDAERELRSGRARGPLHGIPVAVKDLIDIGGMHTTGGSVSRRDAVATEDAAMVARLRAAGAILVGKNTLYEFGLGLPRDSEWPTAARNPWALDRIPGGSSSGSAVAVSAGMVAGSFGTDTGGSIRGPASYCGVVGMKPTFGLIATDGCLALSWTLDHIGPMARSVEDTAALLSGASGRDVRLGQPRSPTRVGVPRTLVDAVSMEPDVASAFETAVSVFQRGGATVVDVILPELDRTEATLLAIIGSEGLAAHLPALAATPEAIGRSARERLTAGLVYSGVDYVNAMRYRETVIDEMRRLYEHVDVLLSPVTLQVAPTNADFQRDPPHRTPFTGIHNLVGAPAVVLPIGFDRAGLPIGLQLAGPHGADADLLTAARWYELETGWTPPMPIAIKELRKQ